jgi:predicted phage tail protein
MDKQQHTGLLQVQKTQPKYVEKGNAFIRVSPFDVGSYKIEFPLGATLQEILEVAKIKSSYIPKVYIGTHLIDSGIYHLVRPKRGQTVYVNVLPQKAVLKALGAIVGIAVAIAAPYLAAAIAPTLGIAVPAAGAFSLGFSALTAGIGLALNTVTGLIFNSIAGPATPKLSSGVNPNSTIETQSQTYYIQGARNVEAPGAPVSILLGQHRIVPKLAAKNYTRVEGNKVYSRQLFQLSWGKLEIEQEKLGETPLESYLGVESENILDGNSTGDLTLYPAVVNQQSLTKNLTDAADWVQERTMADVDEFIVRVVFPNGLVRYDNQNEKQLYRVAFQIRYSEVGSTNWTTFSLDAQQAKDSAHIVSRLFKVPRGQYDVQVRRATPEQNDIKIRDDLTWTALVSYRNETPVLLDGMSMKALSIQGTEQLNGSPDQYNLVGRQIECLDYNPETDTWEEGFTNNPAAIFRYVLQCGGAKKVFTDSRINLEKLQEWYVFCRDKGLTYNAYIDYATDRETLLREIAAAGMASKAQVYGKYTVVIDNEKEDIVSLITPRNSYGYAFEKIFEEYPHAFKVTFLDEEQGYFQNTIVVYDDGYDETNATRFEEIDFPGVTNKEAVHKLARHHMAVVRLRPIIHVVTMDWEHMQFNRGDRVALQYDTALIGIQAARIKAIGADYIDVDEEIVIESGKTYGINVRTNSNTFERLTVQNTVGTTKRLELLTIPSSLAVGDLLAFGETERETADMLVQAIIPQGEENAVVRMVDYSPAIFQASEGAIPTYEAPITIPSEFKRPEPPEVVSVITDESAQIVSMDDSITNRMLITLINNNSFPVETIILVKRAGEDEFQPADAVKYSDGKIGIFGLVQGATYSFELRYRRISGSSLSNNVSEVVQLNNIVFTGTSNPPPDVQNVNIVIRGETAFLEWQKVNVIDLSHYEIRYFSATTGATWESGLIIDNSIDKRITSRAIPSGIGTYMIKAVDRQGNKSANAVFAVTNVGKLNNLNTVLTINEGATWGGVKEGTFNDGGNLKLGGSQNIDDYPLIDSVDNFDFGEGALLNEGIYYFEDTVDLGEVFDNVLTASYTVYGDSLSDKIDDWGLVDSRSDWDGVSPDDYNVELQVRTTNDDPSGSPVTWTEWQRFNPVSEYTARGFQFRLVLKSLSEDITPVVSACTVVIDMPDRDESGSVSDTGTSGYYTVTFNEPFRVAPNVVVTVNNLQSGDVLNGPANVTTSGFDIKVTNGGADVARSIYWQARSYGRQT